MSENNPKDNNINDYLTMESNILLDENEYLLPTSDEYIMFDDNQSKKSYSIFYINGK